MTSTVRHGSSITAEQLLEMDERVAAMKLVASGELDARLAAVKAANAELAKRQGVVATLEEAQKILGDAKAEARRTQDRIAKDIEGARVEVEAARRGAAEASAKAQHEIEQSAAALKRLSDEKAQFEETVRTQRASLDDASKALDERERKVSAHEKAVAEAQAKLKAAQADLNRRLDALKVPV